MPYLDLEKKRQYQRDWWNRRRSEWFNGQRCAQCDSTSRLELHHINPDEKVSHKIWSWSQDRRDEELAKCIVLCFDCHLEESNEQKRLEGHGHQARYASGCRCPECKNAHRIHNAKYRKPKLR